MSLDPNKVAFPLRNPNPPPHLSHPLRFIRIPHDPGVPASSMEEPQLVRRRQVDHDVDIVQIGLQDGAYHEAQPPTPATLHCRSLCVGE